MKKKYTLIIALLSVVVLSIAYAQAPTASVTGSPKEDITASALSIGSCTAWASNEIVDKSSWYSIMCRVSTAGTVKKVVIDFSPDTYDVTQTGTEPISQTNLGGGNLASSAGGVLTYTLNGARFFPSGTTFKLVIGHIINPSPSSPTTYTVQVTTKNNVGRTIETFPATTPVPLEFVDSAEILDGSITTADLAFPVSQLMSLSANDADVDTGDQFTFTCTNGGFRLEGLDFAVNNFTGKSITATVKINGITHAVTDPINDNSLVIYHITGDGFGPGYQLPASPSGTVITVTFSEGSDGDNESATATFLTLTNSDNKCAAS